MPIIRKLLPEDLAGQYFRLRAKPDNPRIMQAQWELDGEWIDVLDATCCDEIPAQALHRLNENGDMEISYDGGETWVQDPLDPRVVGTTLPQRPPETDTSKRCSATHLTISAMIHTLEEMGRAAVTAVTVIQLAQACIEIALAILFAPAAAPALIALLLALVGQIFNAGGAGFIAVINAAYDELGQIVYCAMPENGILTADGFGEIYSKIGAASFDPLAKEGFRALMKVWGLLGMHNAANIWYEADQPLGFDCTAWEECGVCELDWDLTTESHAAGMMSPLGTWVDGSGWNNTHIDPTNSDYHNAALPVRLDNCLPLYIRAEWNVASGAACGIGYNYAIEKDENGDYVWISAYRSLNAGASAGAGSADTLVRLEGEPVIAISLAIDTSNEIEGCYLTRFQLQAEPF